MFDAELLKELCALPGPSGCEDAVADFIERKARQSADSVRRDPLGNVLVFKKGKSSALRSVALFAHMDEVGLAVTRVSDDGSLKFAPVGGIDPRVLAGRRVLIGPNAIPAAVSMKTLHLLGRDERGAAPGFDRLTLDIGARSREEAEKRVTPGDWAVFDAETAEFGDGLLKAKAIDDRAGCAILLQLLQTPQPYDLSLAFTVQEETGSAGARAAAYTLRPDAALVLEATTAADLSGVPAERAVCRLGGGPAVSLMDRRTLYDRRLYHFALELAKENRIPCQLKQAVTGGNDAGVVHLSRGGVKTAALSLPCRYLHSPSCVARLSDADAMLRLAARMAAALAGGAV